MKLDAHWLVKEINAIELQAEKEGRDEVIFGAGYGPSGIPHIGTLCEVLRINTVKQAYERTFKRKTRLVLIADDLDALRKIPANLPNRELLTPFLGHPLYKVPAPTEFSVCVDQTSSAFFNKESGDSLAQYVEKQLNHILSPYNIAYESMSSAKCYESGEYDQTLARFVDNYETITALIAASVGPLRRKTYSIFMPISPYSGRVIEHLEVLNVDKHQGLLTYQIPGNMVIPLPGADYSVSAQDYYPLEPIGVPITVSAYGGHCKLQWKADWAMRLVHRRVAYEMHGDDLADSATVVRQIFQALDVPPTRLYRYGLFTDEQGKKLSKSKGVGLSIANAQDYLSTHALQLYLAMRPNTGRPFSVASIPMIADKGLYLAMGNSSQYDLYRQLAKPVAENDSGFFPWSFHKTLTVLKSCRPDNKSNAVQYLTRYLGRSDLYWFLNPQFSRIWLYFVECVQQHKPEQALRISQQQWDFLSHLSAQLNGLIGSNGTRIIDDIDEIIGEKKGTLSTQQAYAALYYGFIGQFQGPKIATWVEMYGSKQFVTRLAKRLEKLKNTRDQRQQDGEIMMTAINATETLREEAQPTIEPNKLLEPVNFATVQQSCEVFADHIEAKFEEIAAALVDFQCYSVVLDEIERSLELLRNIDINKEFFKAKIQGVATFLPLNQPLYATTCFALIPALTAHYVNLRPPTDMQSHYQRLERVLNIHHFFPNVTVSYEDKTEFVQRIAPITDAVIFTGTPENGAKVRKKFLKRTLFILNGSGHNPLIISKDADVKKAVESVLRVVLYNQGQDCAGPNAILVHSDVYKAVKSSLIAELNSIEHLVGPCQDKDTLVGPNSDPNHTIALASIFKEYRKYCEYGGEINPISGMIKPTIFSKHLRHGGNYKEFFAPVIFLQPFNEDMQLSVYFENSQYYPNAMYVSLFGTSQYVDSLIAKGIHTPDNVLSNTDLHIVEKGYLPYGGNGPAASCLYVNGVRVKGATLPQRDIYLYLVKPHLDAQNENVFDGELDQPCSLSLVT